MSSIALTFRSNTVQQNVNTEHLGIQLKLKAPNSSTHIFPLKIKTTKVHSQICERLSRAICFARFTNFHGNLSPIKKPINN